LLLVVVQEQQEILLSLMLALVVLGIVVPRVEVVVVVVVTMHQTMVEMLGERAFRFKDVTAEDRPGLAVLRVVVVAVQVRLRLVAESHLVVLDYRTVKLVGYYQMLI
jgi:hypothetical protein